MGGDNMTLFKKQIILYLLLLGGACCTALGISGELEMPVQAIVLSIGVIALIGGIIYLFRKFHCPWCRKMYPRLISFSEEFCPHCGEKIE